MILNDPPAACKDLTMPFQMSGHLPPSMPSFIHPLLSLQGVVWKALPDGDLVGSSIQTRPEGGRKGSSMFIRPVLMKSALSNITVMREKNSATES